MKNLIVAIIVILIIVGIVYYVNRDTGDIIEDVNNSEMTDNIVGEVEEESFTTGTDTLSEEAVQ